MDIFYKIRKENFTNAVNKAGTATAFSAAYGINKSTISLYMSGERNITNKKARAIEALIGKPEGWLDIEHSLNPASVTPEASAMVMIHIMRELEQLGISIHQMDEQVLIKLIKHCLDGFTTQEEVSTAKIQGALDLALSAQSAS